MTLSLYMYTYTHMYMISRARAQALDARAFTAATLGRRRRVPRRDWVHRLRSRLVLLGRPAAPCRRQGTRPAGLAGVLNGQACLPRPSRQALSLEAPCLPRPSRQVL